MRVPSLLASVLHAASKEFWPALTLATIVALRSNDWLCYVSVASLNRRIILLRREGPADVSCTLLLQLQVLS